MHEVIVVGAGPAGISMAAEARSAGIAAHRILVLEKGEAHSWSIRKFYPEAKVVAANYKGKAAVCRGALCISDQSKAEALSYLDRAISENGLDVHYGEGVSWIRKTEGGSFEVRSDKATYNSAVCVVAIGVFGKPRKPDYALPAKLRKRIHFDITSVAIEDAEVLVVGGGDSASEYAQYLVENQNRVTLSYRREDFSRMTSINRESLLALEAREQVRIQRSSNIEGVGEEGERPFVRFCEEAHEDLAFDHIVYALGGTTPDNFLKQVGIEFDGRKPKVTEGYETSVPGLFLIGDLGQAGGTIITAFNSAHEAMHRICSDHLDCPAWQEGAPLGSAPG